jgi:hypothetical protein
MTAAGSGTGSSRRSPGSSARTGTAGEGASTGVRRDGRTWRGRRTGLAWAGVSVLTACRRLGHSSPLITYRVRMPAAPTTRPPGGPLVQRPWPRSFLAGTREALGEENRREMGQGLQAVLFDMDGPLRVDTR